MSQIKQIEIEILERIERGHSANNIARDLCVPIGWVESYDDPEILGYIEDQAEQDAINYGERM